MMIRSLKCMMVICALMLIGLTVHAQDSFEDFTEFEDVPTQSKVDPAIALAQQKAKKENAERALFSLKDGERPTFNPNEFRSLVFTHWEYVAIQDARRARGLARAPSDAELMRDLNTRQDDVAPKVRPPPEQRELRLGGIVYDGRKEWTIWLNEKRVTPDAIPEEVLDLKVYKTYIEFKWFDEFTNKIFPIRLRPNQRFNMDTRIFLPG